MPWIFMELKLPHHQPRWKWVTPKSFISLLRWPFFGLAILMFFRLPSELPFHQQQLTHMPFVIPLCGSWSGSSSEGWVSSFPAKTEFSIPAKNDVSRLRSWSAAGRERQRQAGRAARAEKRNGPDAEIKDSVFPPNLTFDAYAACRSSGGVITDAYRLLLRTPPKLRWQYFLS